MQRTKNENENQALTQDVISQQLSFIQQGKWNETIAFLLRGGSGAVEDENGDVNDVSDVIDVNDLFSMISLDKLKHRLAESIGDDDDDDAKDLFFMLLNRGDEDSSTFRSRRSNAAKSNATKSRRTVCLPQRRRGREKAVALFHTD